MRTSLCAFGPYLRRELDFFFAPPRDDEDRLERLLLDLDDDERREDDFFELDLRPFFLAGIQNFSS